MRALKTLASVDVIFAEDTRVTKKLLGHYQIDKPLRSFHEHNRDDAEIAVLGHLANHEDVGLISDAGMPLLSDPGAGLVQKCLDLDINVVCLPGPSAGITGLLMSGLTPIPHLFHGFLDAKPKRRTAQLEGLRYREETLVFYEAPHRIIELMNDIQTVMGDREVVLVREISKKFEEVIRGTAGELAAIEPPKGEFVVVVAGYRKDKSETGELDIVKAVTDFVAGGLTKTEAMKKVAALTGIPKNKIYGEYLEKTK